MLKTQICVTRPQCVKMIVDDYKVNFWDWLGNGWSLFLKPEANITSIQISVHIYLAQKTVVSNYEE